MSYKHMFDTKLQIRNAEETVRITQRTIKRLEKLVFQYRYDAPQSGEEGKDTILISLALDEYKKKLNKDLKEANNRAYYLKG